VITPQTVFAAPGNPGNYARPDVSPGLALFLGTIPGVGAIYNGQYAKGLVHAIIWGMLMSIANSRAANGLEPVFVMLVIAWWAYMAFESYHTARKRQAGEPVDEYSSILDLSGGRSHLPVAGVLLIGLGAVLFRAVQLFFLKDVETGLVWLTKIVTDPFHDILLYHKAPLHLLRGELMDPIVESQGA